MKKIVFSSIALSLLLFSCSSDKKETSEGSAYTPAQIAEESRKANAFFDRAFDAKINRDPMQQSIFGIKTDYGKWQDISETGAQKEVEISKGYLDSLHANFKMEALDEQTKISYRLFEKACEDVVENYKWHLYDYPINQMSGLHNEIPTFLINVHAVETKSDADAYISRLNGIAPLFDQLVENLKLREAKNIVPPKFVFPFV